jgi:hypothetical protein
MSRSPLPLAVGLALASAWPALAASPSAPPDALIWQGRSAGLSVRWTTSDVSIRGGAGAPLYSVRRTIGAEYDKIEREQDTWNAEVIGGDDPGLDADRANLKSHGVPYCGVDDQVRVLSVVGAIVSVREDKTAYCVPMAHPWGGASYMAIDAHRPQKPASLLDWFPDAEVRKALLADKLVGQAIAGMHVRGPLRSSHAIVTSIAGWSGDCTYGFDAAMLSHFAFHHLEGDKVAVRIGLSHGCEAARGSLVQLGLLLPIPQALRQPLKDAEARRSGFLMKDQQAVSKGAFTALSFGTGI